MTRKEKRARAEKKRQEIKAKICQYLADAYNATKDAEWSCKRTDEYVMRLLEADPRSGSLIRSAHMEVRIEIQNKMVNPPGQSQAATHAREKPVCATTGRADIGG